MVGGRTGATIWWTVRLANFGKYAAYDVRNTRAQGKSYNKVISNLLDGGVVLMHQGYTTTVNAVKRLLPDLKERGFQVVSVSELAKAYSVRLFAGQAYSYIG